MTRPRSLTLLIRILAVTVLSLALAIGGVGPAHASDLVNVPDAKLAACIRAKLTAAGLTTELTAENLAKLTRVSCANVNDLTGIEWLTGVSDLAVQVNDSVNLGRLARMPALRSLIMSSSGLTTLRSLPPLPNVTTLNLQSNKLNDIGQLAGFTGVTKLSLQNNQISDLTPLSGMTALQHASLYENRISDLAGLEGASNLASLRISRNQLRDLSPLAGATRLTELEATDNQIETLGDEGSLTSLTKAELSRNRIESIAALSGARLTSVGLIDNLISDISPLSGIAANAKVSLGDNRVRDFSPLPDDANVDAYDQTPVEPTEATIGVPFDFGVRGIDGTPLCPWQLPEGATCDAGIATYTLPSKAAVTFVPSNSDLSVSWVQQVGPTGHLTPSGPVLLTGTARVGEGLWASAVRWTPTAESTSYRWYADGRPLDRLPSSLLILTKADLGKRITVCVTASRDSYYDDEVCSAPTEPVAPSRSEADRIVTSPAPRIIGRVQVGRKLRIAVHHWDPGVTFRFRWQRNGKDIKGATHDVYRLTRADLHKKIRMKLIGSKSGCTSVTRYSNSVRPKR